MAVIHSRVRFIGELLQEIGEGKTHGELNEIARSAYGLPWSTLDQVRRRTAWLRRCDFLELRFDNLITITEAGRQLLLGIETVNPSQLGTTDQDDDTRMPELRPWIASALAGLTSSDLARRKPVMGYIPGPADEVFDTLRSLVAAGVPSISQKDFEALCSTRYALSPASIGAALTMLRGAGLVERTGVDTLAATEAGQAWIADGDEVELVLWLHTRFAFFLEIIPSLMNAQRPRELAAIARSSYGLQREDVGDVRKRLQLLRGAGLVRETSVGRYQATRLGQVIAGNALLFDPDLVAAKADDKLRSPETSTAELLPALRIASRESGRPDEFERVIADAFRGLGFQARWLGGSGYTDVLLQALCAPGSRYAAIVDAKSSASGNVEEGQINFDTLREHKKQHEADFAVVVGPGFRGERLQRRAQEHGVLLLDVDSLEKIIRYHETSPLSLPSYRCLFSQSGIADLQPLEVEYDKQTRFSRLVSRVLFQLTVEARNADPITKGALSVPDLYLILRSEMDNPPTPEELQTLVEFLASSPLGCLHRSGERFAVIEDPATTAIRLRMFSRAALEASTLVELDET
jgi:hypothetical protein